MKWKSMMMAAIAALTVVVADAQVKGGAAAPDFTLTDIEGNTVRLSDYKAKFVVLEWINHDCPFVKKHYNSGNMQELQDEYTGKGVVWLTICSSAPGKQGHFPAAEHQKIAKEKNFKTTAFLIDEDGKVGKRYGAKTTPHMFVIDPDGILIYQGAIDDNSSPDPAVAKTAGNYVRAALDSAMAGGKVETESTAPYGCSVKY